MNENHSTIPKSKIFILVFLMLLTSHGLSLMFGWFYSLDVKSWWAFGLYLNTILCAVYAGVFVAIIGKMPRYSLRWSLLFNLVLAVVSLLHSVIFYLYAASRTGSHKGFTELNLFQKIIFGHFTVYWIYLFFLCVAICYVFLQNRLSRQK